MKVLLTLLLEQTKKRRLQDRTNRMKSDVQTDLQILNHKKLVMRNCRVCLYGSLSLQNFFFASLMLFMQNVMVHLN